MEIALSFVGVFVGAFLAIGLENWRERRIIRRWVREHLDHLMSFLEFERPTANDVQTRFRAIDQALDVWASAAEPLDDETWESLGYTASATAIDFAHLLRSEAVAVLPRALSTAIADVEYWSGRLQMSSDSGKEVFARDVLPLWFERKVPLNDAERRRLRHYQRALRDMLELEIIAVEALDRMVGEYRSFTKAPAPRR